MWVPGDASIGPFLETFQFLTEEHGLGKRPFRVGGSTVLTTQTVERFRNHLFPTRSAIDSMKTIKT